jgi:predicted ferric reductase
VKAHERRSAARAGLAGLGAAAAAATVMLWWRAEGGSPGGGLGGSALALSLGRLAGLLAGLTLIGQLLLAARLPALERWVGLDGLLGWHRRNGATLVTLVALHATLVVAAHQRLFGEPSPWRPLLTLMATRPGVTLAVVAGTLIGLIGVLSLRPVRSRLPYEAWYWVHLFAYAAVALTVPHQLSSGSTFLAIPAARPIWLGAYCMAAATFVGFRWVLPIVRAVRHRLRIESVHHETNDVASLLIQGRRLDALPSRPGQFFVWRILTRSQWWRPHPFSLSAAPCGDGMRITVQAAGTGTRRLIEDTRPGARIAAEGPYGVFTAEASRGDGVLLVGAGVGITPLRAIAESVDDRGGVILLHRARTPDEALFGAEFAALAQDRALTVHLLVGPRRSRGSWLPDLSQARGLSDDDVLRRLVPDVVRRDVFVCGPPQWALLVHRSLHQVGVPASLVHLERFSW